MSVSAGLGSSKHQISPITENSEPESCSSHESQMECNKSSLMFKMSEETNAANITTDENETRGVSPFVCSLVSYNNKLYSRD